MQWDIAYKALSNFVNRWLQGMNTLHIKFISPNLHPLESGCNSLCTSIMLFYRLFPLWAPPRAISFYVAVNIDYNGSCPTFTQTIFPDTTSAWTQKLHTMAQRKSHITGGGTCPFVTYFPSLSNTSSLACSLLRVRISSLVISWKRSSLTLHLNSKKKKEKKKKITETVPVEFIIMGF